MYAPEDGIGLGVLAGTLPPSFDDSGIVPMAPEVIGREQFIETSPNISQSCG